MLAQVWPFVHPALAAAALAAAAIPVVIHLIHRHRYRRVPWAAMTFLLAATRRSAKRMRFEQFLLMAARIGLIVLFGLAVARPFVPSGDWIPWQSSPVHRIILLDNSLSMSGNRSDGRSRFDVARDAATNLLSAFPATDPLSLITLAGPAETKIGSPSCDRRLARELLAGVRPTQQAVDVAGGLLAAAELLKESATAASNRAVYVISDFTETIWLGAPIEQRPATSATDPGETGLARTVPVSDAVRALQQLAGMLANPETDLHLIRTGDYPAPNASLTAISSESLLAAQDLPLRVTVQVTNHSESPLRGAEVEFRRDLNPGTSLPHGTNVSPRTTPSQLLAARRSGRREPLPIIQPGESASVVSSILFSEPGTHIIEARLIQNAPDSLSADDVRYLSVEVRESTRVLLVDGRPGSTPLEGHAGFLAAALSPESFALSELRDGQRAPNRSLVSATTIASVAIAGEPLPSYDVVALCGVPRLSEGEWNRLEQFVADGGGLMVFAGGGFSADNYIQHGLNESGGILPGKPAAPVHASERAASPREGGQERGQTAPSMAGSDDWGALRFSAADLTHPLVAEFRDQPASGLFTAFVRQYVPVEADPIRSRVALRYENGDPAVVTSNHGKGRVVFFTTTANMEWTNLPAKGDYVSLMLSTVAFLTAGRDAGRNLLVGQTATERLDAVQSAMELRVVGPDGGAMEPEISPLENGLSLRAGPARDAGVLTMMIGIEARRFAINPDPIEFDLTVAGSEGLDAQFAHPVHWIEAERVAETGVRTASAAELGAFALYAAMLLLLIELWLANRFAAWRGPSPTKPGYAGGQSPLNPGYAGGGPA